MKEKDPVLVKFGNIVREERLKRSLSQEKFAAMVGVHRTYIGMVERAEKNVTLVNIQKIAEGLNLNISSLFKDF